MLNIQGQFVFESSVSENLVYLRQFVKAAIYSRRITGVGDFFGNLKACGQYLFPLVWKYIVDNRILVPSTSKISLAMQGEHVAVCESRIRIDPSTRDANGLPRAVLDWRMGADELRSIQEFVRRCGRALRAAGLADLEIPEQLKNGDEGFLETLRDSNHPSGGARMGMSDRDGVVDRDLRVFGTTNLFVIGAATFRTTSNANTTFTALALATRLVDHLSARHGAV